MQMQMCVYFDVIIIIHFFLFHRVTTLLLLAPNAWAISMQVGS